ncbi:hypothetical protein POM88_032532 [Heracleum sosnowskyi]|uniref:Uncharacterized protein n=1 Tax=Heracleum sosnowskyi TaxID=360622 RepID=A0AAD8MKY3_9APIA|nr:hypothetical protein POM88_032532 [Heracleum sosnowskyi]
MVENKSGLAVVKSAASTITGTGEIHGRDEVCNTRTSRKLQTYSRPVAPSTWRKLIYTASALVINPDPGQADAQPPLVDFCDIEIGYSNKFPGEGLTGDMAYEAFFCQERKCG